MKQTKVTLYLTGWFAYVVFTFLAFPQLKITVMLFSIPLTMLGGWFYTYRGALYTTILTILYHYLMLRHHTTDPSIVIEAFNLFGIGTQLAFSMGTALLKASQVRYQQLNSALEDIVGERTLNLCQLTDHLIETKEMKIALATTGLMNEPMEHLNTMLKTSRVLVRDLKDAQHQRLETAETIENLIRLCTHQLIALEYEFPIESNSSASAGNSIYQLVQYFESITGHDIQIVLSGNWEKVSPDTSRNLHPIIHEATTNALRHANPTLVTISVQSTPSAYVVAIENNGKPIQEDAGTGMGISLMRYRARRMGATLSIGTNTEQNTRIECVIPRPLR